MTQTGGESAGSAETAAASGAGAVSAEEITPMLLRERIRFVHEDKEDEKIGDFARMKLNDDHIPMVIDALKNNPANNDTVKVLDLSFNKIGDVGMQQLIGFFAIKTNLAALETLKVHNNATGVLGKQMLDAVKMFRKNVVMEREDVVDDKQIYAEDSTPKPAGRVEEQEAPKVVKEVEEVKKQEVKKSASVAAAAPADIDELD